MEREKEIDRVDEPVKFAVSGYGHIGRRHAEMVERNPESALVGIIDPRGNKPVHAAPLFPSIADFFNSGIPVDVVSVATPNGLHARQALEVLNLNKDVLIEKPVTLRVQDAMEIMETARALNRRVFTVLQNRYSQPSVWLKGLLESGRLGRIFMVQVNCFWNRDERYYEKNSWRGTKNLDGGTLYTQFSHFVDMLCWLFGDLSNIRSRFANFNHQGQIDFEDSGIVTFEFGKGGMGTLNYSTAVWDKNMESSLTIIAEYGALKVAGQYMDRIEYCHVKDYTAPDPDFREAAGPYAGYQGAALNHHFVIANVVDVLKGRAEIQVPLTEGLKVVDLISQIYASAGKAPHP